jgi:hypothetical protein
MAAITKPVQTSAPDGAVHAATSASTEAGAETDRRRLSSIFQRPMAGTSARSARLRRGPEPRIHGSNCQSPRVQRWCRKAATS